MLQLSTQTNITQVQPLGSYRKTRGQTHWLMLKASFWQSFWCAPPSLPTLPRKSVQNPLQTPPQPASPLLFLFNLTHKGDLQNESAKQVYVLLPAVTQNGWDLATLRVVRFLWKTSIGYLWWWESNTFVLGSVWLCVYLCVRERGTIQRRRNAGVGIPPDIISSLSCFCCFVAFCGLFLLTEKLCLKLNLKNHFLYWIWPQQHINNFHICGVDKWLRPVGVGEVSEHHLCNK